MGSVVGPKSTQDVREFLAECTGMTVLGCGFERAANGHLVLRCGYIDPKGVHRTKRIELGFTGLSLHDEVVELSVIMSEWLQHGQGHMLELLNG